MAIFKSDQITNLDKTPREMLDPTEGYGKLRALSWSYKTPASGAPAVGDDIYLCEIPKGAKVLGIFVDNEALSSGAGTAGADLGDDDDSDRYAAAVNFDAATYGFVSLRVLDSANEIGQGVKSTKARRLRARVTGEAFAVNSRFDGYALVVVE